MDTSRWPWALEVPTIKELGYNFYVIAITGIAAPRGTPQPILDKLQDVFKKTMEDSEFKEVMERIYFKPEFFSGKEYRKLLEDDYNQNHKILLDLGIHKSQKK